MVSFVLGLLNPEVGAGGSARVWHHHIYVHLALRAVEELHQNCSEILSGDLA